MFSFLGRMAYRWRWAILIFWGAALLLSLPVLPRVAGSLKVGGFSSPNTEAARAREVLQRELGFAPSTLLVVFQTDTIKVDDPAFQAAIDHALAGVRTLPSVTGIILPSADPSLISSDRDT